MRDPRAALFLVATALIGALPSCGGGRLGSSAGGAGGGGSLAAGSGGAGGGGSVASGMGGGVVAGRIGGAGGPPVTGAGGDCEMRLGGVAAAGADANGGNDRTNGGNGADPSASETLDSGAGGVFGGGGSGGQDAPYPACDPDVRGEVNQRRMLLGEDGLPIGESLTAAVTVSAIDGANVTLADATGGRRWTWSPNIPNLPANRINVGDRFDLTVDAHAVQSPPGGPTCQTVVLARCGTLVAFNSERATPTCASLPPLDAWGISVTNAGPVCEHPSTDIRCDGFYFFATQVSIGNTSTVVAPGQTIARQGLSFSLREFSGPTDYACDGARAIASMAGFRLP